MVELSAFLLQYRTSPPEIVLAQRLYYAFWCSLLKFFGPLITYRPISSCFAQDVIRSSFEPCCKTRCAKKIFHYLHF